MYKSKKRVYILALILGFLLCVVVLGALFWVNRDNANSLVRSAEDRQTDRRHQGVSDTDSARSLGQDGSTVTYDLLAAIIDENRSLFDQKRAILRVVAGASEQELVDIFRDARQRSLALRPFNSMDWVQSVVLTKLITENSQRAQSLIEESDDQDAESILYFVMREWDQVHSSEAITLLSPLEHSLRIRGLRGLIDGGNYLSRTELLAIGTALGFEEDVVTEMLDRRRLAQKQITFLGLKAEFETLDLSDIFQLHNITQNAVSYVRAEGLDSLESVLELFDTRSTESTSPLFGNMLDSYRSNIVEDISWDDPEEAFEYVVRLDEEIDEDLLTAVCEVWFATDPGALWIRLSGKEFAGVQDQITENIISGLSWAEPDLLLVSIDEFPSEFHDQVYLQVAQRAATDSPGEALALLAETSVWPETPVDRSRPGEFSPRNWRIKQIVGDAAQADPLLTIEWLNSDASQLDDETRQQYLDDVFQAWTRSDPDSAFEMALQAPVKEGSVGLEATVVSWLSHQNVDGAIALLPRVREGKTRLEAYRDVAWQLEEQDRISEAVQLGDDLPEKDREEYLQSLAFSVGTRTPYDHLEAGIRQLPTTELKSEAARSALLTSFAGSIMSPDFTDKEVNQLKTFLRDDDKVMVEAMESFDLEGMRDKLPETLPDSDEELKDLLEDTDL